MKPVNQNEQRESLSLIWVRLGEEDRIGIIQLMAQLALKQIIAQIENNLKEVAHAEVVGVQNSG